MNKKLQVGTLITVLILLLIGGLFAVTQSSIGTQYVEAPQWGYLECAPDGLMEKTSQAVPASDSFFITCGMLGLSEQCTATIKAPNEGIVSTGSSLQYQYCRSHNDCDAIQVLPGGSFGYDGETKTLPLTYTQFLKVGFFKGTLSVTPRTGATYDLSGTVFSLKVRDAFRADNGRTISRKGSCVLEESYFLNNGLTFASPGFTLEYDGVGQTRDTLNHPYEVYSYFSGFVTIPSESSRIETTNGKPSYCSSYGGSGGKLLELKKVSSTTSTYMVVDVNSVLGSVACCNGDVTPGKVCQNHAWIDSNTATCTVWQPCEGSQWNTYSNKQMIHQTCVDGACIDEIKTVACARDTDCATGACYVDYTNPANNKCVEGGSYVPPSDWWGTLKGMILSNLLIFAGIVGIITFLALLLILKNSTMFKWEKDKAYILALTAITGFLIGWLVFNYWWVFILAGVGLVIIYVMVKK